ncbi:hypothetical protein K458DRAFT_406499 [Lentithecium fluviatile CBS 122367]|uniref:Uncharacterized protein n=1 Tax=Lentithecium fluviatile CBS 122367 TaxID=1168545 RepID=A0A6G1ITD7_9PLEO|nr:hypothetical protein K458DRAFT_406499 [Lentithecium fluviatile CBS 122367]
MPSQPPGTPPLPSPNSTSSTYTRILKRRKISPDRFIPSHIPSDLWGSDTEPDEDAEELAREYLHKMNVETPREEVTLQDQDRAYGRASSGAQNRKESSEEGSERSYVLEINPTISALAQELEDEEDAAREKTDESDSGSAKDTFPLHQRPRILHSTSFRPKLPMFKRLPIACTDAEERNVKPRADAYRREIFRHAMCRNSPRPPAGFSSSRTSQSPSEVHKQEYRKTGEKRKRADGSGEPRVEIQRPVKTFREARLILRKG